MALAIFPPTAAALGVSYQNERTEIFSTLQSISASGRRVSAAQWTAPMRSWNWTIPKMDIQYVGGNQLRHIVGFYYNHAGSNLPFLIRDTEDFQLTQQVIGLGDGANKLFQVLRTYGTFVEPIYDVWSQDPDLKVWVEDGFGDLIALGGGTFSVDDFGLVTLDVAPLVGRRVAISVQYFFRVYFKDDSMTSTQLLDRIWMNEGIELVSQRD